MHGEVRGTAARPSAVPPSAAARPFRSGRFFTHLGQLDHIERELQFDGDLSEDQRARLLDIAERCPVHRMLHSEVLISTTESVQ
jgi:uncharacterized OsmC-like protein